MQKGTHGLALTRVYDSADAAHLRQTLQPAGINRLQQFTVAGDQRDISLQCGQDAPLATKEPGVD
jgi:hypothetical protein